MASKQTRGIVIFETPFGEKDKMITVFSERGKFKAIAHGSRLPKSKIAAGTRLFSWSNFVYTPGASFARIKEADLIEPFLGIGDDFEKLTYASYCMDLLNTFYEEDQLDRAVLKLSVYYLYYLSHTDVSARLLTLAFQLKLAFASGIAPTLTNKKELIESGLPIYFHISDGSFSNHHLNNKNYSYRIDPEMLETIYKLLKLPLNDIKELKDIDENKFDRLIEIFNHFLEYHAERSVRSFKIITEMNSINLEEDL